MRCEPGSGYASFTCAHVPVLNGCINTLDFRIYIPTNKSEFSQSRHTQRLSDVTTVINIMML